MNEAPELDRAASTRWRLGVMLASAALARVALAPGSAGATITIGSDLAEPAGSQPIGCGDIASPCASLLVRTKPGNAYPTASPTDGTVVSFGVRSGGAETLTFRLLRLDSAIAAKVLLVRGVGTGPTVEVPGAGTFEFGTSLPIEAGDWLGVDSSASTAYGDCGGGAETWRLTPPVTEGGSLAPVPSSEGCELLVDAVVEPSAAVDFAGGKVTRAGRAILSLRLPGPGTLTLRGEEIRTMTRDVAEAGGADLLVRLRSGARRRLASSGHVRLAIATTFAPTGGASASEARNVEFKEARR